MRLRDNAGYDLATDEVLRNVSFQPDGSVDTSFGEAGQGELERPARLFAIDRRAGRVVAVSDPIGIGSTLGGLLIARLWL